MELKATELRVNNYLEFKDTLFQVEIITLTGGLQIYRIDYDSGYQFIIGQVKDFKPIPLTEEWAIKFGYECLIEMITDLEERSIIFIEFDYVTLLEKIQKGEMMVHKWQNIWQSLTEEELTIKE